MLLAEGVHSIGQKKGGRVHAFLFEHADGLTLVDTLFDDDARRARVPSRARADARRADADRADARAPLAPRRRRQLKELSDATVYAHEFEADIVAGERKAQTRRLLPLFPLRLIPFRVGLALGRPKHVPCPVDDTLDDGDALGPLEVLHIPGHSPGHLGFHWAERGVLIVGDAIATWPSVEPGWKGFELNEEQHRDSLARLASLDAKVVGVGHGEPVTDAAGDLVHLMAERS